jgi:hypothetical protein
LSLFGAGMTVTSLRDVYPPELTFVCLSNAWKMFQPQFLYLHYGTRKVSWLSIPSTAVCTPFVS